MHLGSKHLDYKTPTILFETESNDRKPKHSFDFTSKPVIFEYSEEPIIFDYLDKHLITSFECKQDDYESCDLEINLHLAYQLLEDESDINRHFRY